MIRYPPRLETVSLSIGLPSNRTVLTERGCIKRRKSRLTVLNIKMILEIFNPPAVEPAQPPINIKVISIIVITF